MEFCSSIVIILSIRYERPVSRYFTLSFVSISILIYHKKLARHVAPTLEPVSVPKLALTNILLMQLIITYIKQAQDYLIGPQNDTDRANSLQTKTKIQRSTYLEQWYPKSKQSLKISFNFQDKQPTQSKILTLQVKVSLLLVDQLEATERSWKR